MILNNQKLTEMCIYSNKDVWLNIWQLNIIFWIAPRDMEVTSPGETGLSDVKDQKDQKQTENPYLSQNFLFLSVDSEDTYN